MEEGAKNEVVVIITNSLHKLEGLVLRGGELRPSEQIRSEKSDFSTQLLPGDTTPKQLSPRKDLED